ncbi:DUF3953 domain-containing protein [Bacillus sp. CLL-7-23]|uniref:DUF3953 domain-containing protein n=1 Tax=Bacillus changyiensis TaxID=3004103 RepID=A0ABT4X5F9_9BACI|nr:DUF3953 domain-containing protein [Bacillus changyiensis]MDA7027528.1 DUF3953 domain-containing protein [Bacillus changyiensis]
MLKILRIMLAITVVVSAGYVLVTNHFDFQPYMLFFLSLLMLVMGLDEFQKGRKDYGLTCIVLFLFVFFVSVQGFFFNS